MFLAMYYIIVTPFFPSSESFRGSFIYDQAVAIKNNSSYNVLVFKVGNFLKKESYTIDGIEVNHLPAIQFPSYILNGFFNPINAQLFIKLLRQKDIAFEKIFTIHTHTANLASYALAAKRVNNRILTIVQHHDLDPFNIRNGKFARHKWNALYRANNSLKLFNEVDLHVCISKIVEENLRLFPHARPEETYESYLQALKVLKSVPSANLKKTYILHNGVDTRKFFKSFTNKARQGFHVGCIANFVELKDHITLLKAIRICKSEVSNLKVTLIGSGPTLLTCKQYIKEHELGDIVSIEPEVKHDMLALFYHTLDLFVLPSYFEGFGCVYTEAAACGVPFVCCKHQGAAECISPDTANEWLINRGDYRRLAEIIIRQAKNNINSQTLTSPYDINQLICKFIKDIKLIHV